MLLSAGSYLNVAPGQADRIECRMLQTFDFVIPQVGNVPIFHCRPSRPVGYATVDDWALEIVTALGPWYLQEVRMPMSPRISFRVDGAKRYLNLTRLVVLLSQRANRHIKLDPPSLWKDARDIPPVRINDGNPFNATLANLHLAGTSAATVAKYVNKASLSVPVPLALPEVPPQLVAGHGEITATSVNDLESTDPLMSAEDILLGQQRFPAQSQTVQDIKDLLK